MTAENVYQIAIHLSEKELAILCDMLQQKSNLKISIPKSRKCKILSDNDAVLYLLKNVFSKKDGNYLRNSK